MIRFAEALRQLFPIGLRAAAALGQPAICEQVRAGFHELLSIGEQMLAVFRHHFKPPTAPFLTCGHRIRDRTRRRQFGSKLGSEVGFRLHAIEPFPICLLQCIQELSLSVDKNPQCVSCPSSQTRLTSD